MSRVVDILLVLWIASAVLSWLIGVINFFVLRAYAASEGLNPAHAWKLFGPIEQDKSHPMHNHLKSLKFCTLWFIVVVGTSLIAGMLTEGFDQKPTKHTGIYRWAKLG